MQKDQIEVTVKEALHEDAGRGIARLGVDVMKALGLVSGDVIEIQGKQKAAAIVWPGYPEDIGRGVIRIDGYIRGNAHIGIDDTVKIRKAEAKYAEKVVFQPTQPISHNGGERTLKRLMNGQPVVEGQVIGFRDWFGNPLTFVISKVTPAGVAIISERTDVVLKETPYKPDESVQQESTGIHYEDIGGLGRELDMVREMIELPLRHPEIFERLGIEPPKGVLLYGPPGTGKTLIAKAVATEVKANFISISGPEIMGKYYGESEERLREVFKKAQEDAPTIVFIDEIDSIAPKREETKGEVERRVVAQLLSLMDGLKARGQVVVIAATNIPDAIDPALRRGGRFDREIEIGIPDRKGRLEIFQVHTRGVPLADDVDLQHLADVTHGFVGADISLLVKEAAMHALRQVIPKIKIEEEIPTELIEKLRVTADDFDEARKHVEPSAMREVLVEVPPVTWDDVGGLDDVKEELTEAVEWPLKYPEVFARMQTKPPKGILLFGPPGTGKTLLAKATANQSECNFISVKGPELLSKWVGESEKGVREIFRKARQAAPSIIFFDEIDALVPKRGSYATSSHVTESVVSQLLTELDGLEELKSVMVLGATNRPDMLDDALLRPGRLDRIVYVPPPDRESRKKIFEVYLKGADEMLASDVSVDDLVERSDGYVGADIEAIVREAKLAAMREFIAAMQGKTAEERSDAIGNVRITKKHFDTAFEKVRGSLSPESLEEFERLSWEILYSHEQRSTLEKAASLVKRAGFAVKGNEEAPALAKDLREAVYAKTKDIPKIETLSKKLEEALEQH